MSNAMFPKVSMIFLLLLLFHLEDETVDQDSCFLYLVD